MVPEITFMRILIYGSTCVCVCVWAKQKCNANIDKYMQRHFAFVFPDYSVAMYKTVRRDSEVGVATVYEVNGAGFESWKGK